MNTRTKKLLHHAWTYVREIRPLYLFIALVILATGTVLALRHNNQTMANLRQAVYTADEENGDVEGALRELRKYVYAHMNTDLSSGSNTVYPPIQLKHTYDRLLEAEQARVKQANETIYTRAQAHCERLYPQSFSGGPRVPCIREYVTANGIDIKVIPDSLYKFDFVSPRWSPDLAGWGVVVTAITAILLLVRLVVHRILQYFHIT
jgi:hypothetical protein